MHRIRISQCVKPFEAALSSEADLAAWYCWKKWFNKALALLISQFTSINLQRNLHVSPTMTSPTESPPFTRLPFTGSCHCNTIRYVVYLRIIDLSKLPAYAKVNAYSYRTATGGQSRYRCNCTVHTQSRPLPA